MSKTETTGEIGTASRIGKILRVVGLVVVIGLLSALVIFNVMKKPSYAEQVWDEGTTVGSTDAKHYFVMYTDLACPYCDVFSRAIKDHQEEFEQLLAEKSILFEVRVTDFLYKFGENGPEMSLWSAKGAECATQKGKFWDYYHQALSNLWDDYNSKGIGTSKTAPAITGMTEGYWVKVAKDAGMDEKEFSECMADEATEKAVDKKTERAYKAMAATGQGGMPFFNFEELKTSGFSETWGWKEVKQYFLAGLGEA